MGRLVLAVTTAALLIASVAIWHDRLLGVHNQLCVKLLSVSGIPVSGVELVDLFPGLSQAPVAATTVVRLDQQPARFAAAFAAAMLVILLLHRFLPLARGFLLFLVALLLVSAIVGAFFPERQFNAAQFGQIWLRGEILVWLLLPLFSAGTVIVLHPAGILGVMWAVLVQLYGLGWSAVRLAFFVGIMHYSGILFVPLLWFAFGLLADMVYLMVFYSLAVRWIASEAWGRRSQ